MGHQYQVVDVETEGRPLEIAALGSAVPGRAAYRSSSRSTCVRSWTTVPSDAAAKMEAWLEGAGRR